jgi:hypothetical protein
VRRAKTIRLTLLIALLAGALMFLAGGEGARSGIRAQGTPQAFLGFDCNEYPGDAALPELRRTFAFAGYWLNSPPGAKSNTWRGKREILRQNGFGFLVLFNGRIESELKASAGAEALGAADAEAAAASARREGFSANTVVFLDQEEGGRMTEVQLAYISRWIRGVLAAGFRAGIYCSGIPAKEAKGQSVITADDIRQHLGSTPISFFVYNDACPPSPGCVYRTPPVASGSGVAYASVWQFAQSPRRRNLTRACSATYDADGNCYPPLGNGSIMLDLDSATSADPSSGISRHIN